jgi:hypothetical protein
MLFNTIYIGHLTHYQRQAAGKDFIRHWVSIALKNNKHYLSNVYQLVSSAARLQTILFGIWRKYCSIHVGLTVSGV